MDWFENRTLNLPQTKVVVSRLGKDERMSIYYHNLFDYPLNLNQLIKWRGGPKAPLLKTDFEVCLKNGYFFLKGRQGIVLKRIMHQRMFIRKMQIAQKAAKRLGLIPTIKMVAVTGSLAMANADEGSDIDLMIITKRGFLWTTRALSWLILKAIGFKIRKPNQKNEKDKLCLNIWLDESDLIWRKRNIFTAHEIAQIIPLFNKDNTYETYIAKNKWVTDYWPNAVKVKKSNKRKDKRLLFFTPIEKLAYFFQLAYMKKKMTIETIKPTRAVFHPNDLSEVVLPRLNIS